MKRTTLKNKRGLKLERRLELVRTTIRELTPLQLERANGAYGYGYPLTGDVCVAPTAGCTDNCCDVGYTY
jgi:hypothetical protein